jgi:SAM-dependent methyltransferase
MIQSTEKALVQNAPWFKVWFDSPYYHRLYAHRSEEEAANFINELVAVLQPKQNAAMLDVGCGNGRHCRQLAAKGFDVTGIDLAFSSIRHARKFAHALLQFFQHDMRQPFGNNHFDYVFNFFTSFGYFKNDEHHKVLRNMRHALKPGGTLVLDYMNIHYAEKRLIAREEKEIDGITYYITRWTDEKHFFKKIMIDEDQAGKPVEYTEQVAKFSLPDFERMLRTNNFIIENVHGDYWLNEFDKRNSPRLIMIARKRA